MNLVTLGAVYTHTHTDILINKKFQGLEIAFFVVSQNIWGTICFVKNKISNIFYSLKDNSPHIMRKTQI